jgi:molybdenum cofactor biosynthesis enzyme
MVKGIEKGIVISEIVLLAKDGGRSGSWRREG